MTEDEAKSKICPFLPLYQGAPVNCIGSACMAWRVLPAANNSYFGSRLASLLKEEKYINAIKEWRGEYGTGLKEAKDAIDEIRAGTRPIPGFVEGGYCGAAGFPR